MLVVSQVFENVFSSHKPGVDAYRLRHARVAEPSTEVTTPSGQARAVKPLYGNQEQAVRGYNPTKQGRLSHVYQTYSIAAIRMVLDVEVQPGNQTASQYAQPGLWAWLDRRPREQALGVTRESIDHSCSALLWRSSSGGRYIKIHPGNCSLLLLLFPKTRRFGFPRAA